MVQPTLDGLGTPLRDVTFVVLDLETTGGAPDGGGITEIGAVKVRGGEELGVFATLVNPGEVIPPFITVLTGITQAMVLPAPPIEEALPPLLEFLTGSVFVAHNAPFDTGFLKAACGRHGYPWPALPVIDTAALARRLLTGDEVPNNRLGTLAHHFRTATRPTHRALDDARATVEVLHALIGRLGSHQVYTLEEMATFATAISPAQRRKRHLAEGLPSTPGVYIFRDARGRALYVGTSSSIATRVRSYFTAAETRKRMSEMIHVAERVEAIECAHSLEAEVRELRIIAAQKPPYNRRSKFPERVAWLKLTTEVFSAALPRHQDPRRRCRLPRPVLVAPRGRTGGGGGVRGDPGPPVHPPAVRPPAVGRVRPGRDGAVRGPVRAAPDPGGLPGDRHRRHRERDRRRSRGAGGGPAPPHRPAV